MKIDDSKQLKDSFTYNQDLLNEIKSNIAYYCNNDVKPLLKNIKKESTDSNILTAFVGNYFALIKEVDKDDVVFVQHQMAIACALWFFHFKSDWNFDFVQFTWAYNECFKRLTHYIEDDYNDAVYMLHWLIMKDYVRFESDKEYLYATPKARETYETLIKA